MYLVGLFSLYTGNVQLSVFSYIIYCNCTVTTLEWRWKGRRGFVMYFVDSLKAVFKCLLEFGFYILKFSGSSNFKALLVLFKFLFCIGLQNFTHIWFCFLTCSGVLYIFKPYGHLDIFIFCLYLLIKFSLSVGHFLITVELWPFQF